MNQYATGAKLANTVVCDLRSDTVTKPDAAMLAAMAKAEVGDDVYGEDPSILQLETVLAERLGKAAGLFCSSGTQSNLVAMLTHCARGEEVITGRGYHVQKYEAGGASVLGGLVIDALPVAADGSLNLESVLSAIKDDDPHFPISRLLSVENTHNGQAVGLDTMAELVSATRERGLSTHLDGARLFNAARVLGVEAGQVTEPFDTISVCLSKGLGAPVGSVLLGPVDMIARARRWRKMLGGGLRQAGVLAAAGLYALDNNIIRLHEDHQRAEALAATLLKSGVGTIKQASNMVFWQCPQTHLSTVQAHMAQQGVVLSGDDHGTIRMVLHKDISDAAFTTTLRAFRDVL